MDGWVDDWMNEGGFSSSMEVSGIHFRGEICQKSEPSRRAQIFCNFIFENDFQRPPWNFIGGWVDE